MIHEVSHGIVALWLGDPTAKYMGRLTLNPAKHIDPVGSILVPLISKLTLGFAFGWAKPVPYNPYNLRDQRFAPAIVGLAGPVSNILIALTFGFFLRIFLITGAVPLSGEGFLFSFFYYAIIINLILAVFNLLPIPPLDGSKLVFAVLDLSEETKYALERYSMFFFFIIIFLFIGPISMIISIFSKYFFKLIVGI